MSSWLLCERGDLHLAKMRIPLAKPFVCEEHIEAIKKVMHSGRFISGEETRAFEDEFARAIGTKYAVATSSGTAALHLAVLACEIGEGDEVITASHTFIATVESIWHVGAKPRLAEVDESYYTIDPESVEKLISKKTRAIIPVHIYGHPADMDALVELAERNNLTIIEDAAQAHGSQYKERLVGTLGDVACFSFFPSKNLTVCGDGGILVTNDEDISQKAKMLRDHGRKDRYSSAMLGYNYRLSEIASAIGRVSLRHLADWNTKRREIARSYTEALSNESDIMTPQEATWAHHVYHVYAIRSPNRQSLREWLMNNGIETGLHYPIPCHAQPIYRDLEGDVTLPRTERICREVLSLPIHPEMTDADVEYVTSSVRQFNDNVSR